MGIRWIDALERRFGFLFGIGGILDLPGMGWRYYA
jgi:hypothetical protein